MKWWKMKLITFVARWIFESDKTPKSNRKKKSNSHTGSDSLPECTHEEYNEFLNCLKRGERKFQTAGRTVHDEYAAWLKDYRKKLALAQAAKEKAKLASPDQAAAGDVTHPA